MQLNKKATDSLRVLGLIIAVGFVISFQNCSEFQANPLSVSTNVSALSINSALSDNDASITNMPNISNKEGYDIILIGGQSNAVGYGCGTHTDVATDLDGKIYQVDPSGNVIQATDPLFFNASHANLIGFGMSFARLYAKHLTPKRSILLVPVAQGATSILQWDNKDDGIDFVGTSPLPLDSTQLWDSTVARTTIALEANSLDNHIVALLWHQGENDYGAIKGVSPMWAVMHNWMPSDSVYQSRLQSVFNLFRSEFGGGQPIPIIAGQIGSFWANNLDPDPGGALLAQFNAGLASVIASTPNSSLVSADGLVSDAMDGCSTDTAHFSASSQVTFGRRYFAAYQSLVQTTSTQLYPVADLSASPPISYGQVRTGVPISCDSLNPDAIKSLSTDTIQWLATIQPSGLTLHETYMIARQSGYTGALGHGEHALWLSENPGPASTFLANVQNMAQGAAAPWASWAQHNSARRAAGYQGLFLCGGDACFQAGQCDNLGRRF